MVPMLGGGGAPTLSICGCLTHISYDTIPQNQAVESGNVLSQGWKPTHGPIVMPMQAHHFIVAADSVGERIMVLEGILILPDATAAFLLETPAQSVVFR